MSENVEVMGEIAAAPAVEAAPSARRANPLANLNLRLLWMGESISLLGDQFYMVALPWLVLTLTGSAVGVGTVFAVSGIPRALLMLVGGVMTDRLSPRVVMLVSNASRIVITGLLALLVMTHAIQVWMLYVFSLLFGVVDAFFFPAYTAMVPMIVEDADLEAGNATMQGTSQLVNAIGPGIGGELIKLAGIGFSFLLDAVSFAVATVTLLFMDTARIVRPAAPARRGSILGEIKDAFAYMWNDPLLRAFMLIVVALNFLFDGPMLVGPVMLARDRFTEGSVALGILLSAVGAGMLVGMLLAVVLKPTRIGLMTLSSIGMTGLCIAAIGSAHALWLAAALYAVGSASAGFSNLLLITWFQRNVNKDMMGRLISILMLSSTGLMPISASINGFVADWNLTALYVINGALLVVTVVVALLNQRVRSLRA